MALRNREVPFPIVLEAALQGVFASGQSLASFALPLAIAPRSGRPFYLAAFLGAGGGYFAAAIVGGSIAGCLPVRVTVLGHPVHGLELLFVLGALGRLGATAVAAQACAPQARAGAATRLLRAGLK
jgi:hypothetical protein